MKRLLRPSFARAVLSTLCLAVTGMAQSTAFDTATMTAALSLREDVAKAVREKRDPVAGALARLKAAASPSGLKLDRDTDFALAAVDVGQRLLAAGDPESAEPFFREAEKSLDAVIDLRFDEVSVPVIDALAVVALLAKPRITDLGPLGIVPEIELAERDGIVGTAAGRVQDRKSVV